MGDLGVADGGFPEDTVIWHREGMIANSDRSTLTPDGSLTALVAPDRRPRPRRGLLGRSDGLSMAFLVDALWVWTRSRIPKRDGARVSSAASEIAPIEVLPKVQMHDSILRMKRTILTVQMTQDY